MSPHVPRKSRPSRVVHGWEALRAGCGVVLPKAILWLTETIIAAYIFKHVLRS